MRKVIFVISSFVLGWLLIFGYDYVRVVINNEKPVFVVAIKTADDGGAGTYQGLGYCYEIAGNFMPLDEIQGVTSYELYLFNHLIAYKKD